MATDRVLALQARLDDARDMLKAELKKEAPRDTVMAVIKQHVQELNVELKMLSALPGVCSAVISQYVTCVRSSCCHKVSGLGNSSWTHCCCIANSCCIAHSC